MYAIAESQIEQLLPYPDLVRALCELYSGKRQIVIADRTACMTASPHLWMGLSGALCPDSGLGVAKVGLEGNSPDNSALLADSLLIASDGRRGKIIATIAAETLTARRTAATTIAIAKLLKRANVRGLTLIGTGVQAKAHLDACHECLSLDRIYLCGRTRDRTLAFIEGFAKGGRTAMIPTEDLKSAIADSQMAIAATSSATPVLLGEYLHPGLHIAAIGAYEGGGWELEAAAIEKTDLILVDSLTGAMKTADLAPLRNPSNTPSLQTPQDYLSSAHREPLSPTAITLWKSVGTAEQDLMATEILLKTITHKDNYL